MTDVLRMMISIVGDGVVYLAHHEILAII